ncbi:MAG TPA: substrate-binding domain-containing protein [Spirochaetia bacterium]
MGITQKDIAEALKISLITVHRALNGTGYVSPQLREKILAYARKARYVPHKASKVLLRNRTRKIALFSSSLPHYFWSDIRTGITIAAEQIAGFNYEVTYRTIPERNSRAYLARLNEALDDGAEAVGLVNQWIYDMKALIAAVERRGVPWVTLNVDAPQSSRLCYIGPDYPAGGRLAAEYIGSSLLFRSEPHVLVITTPAEVPPDFAAPDINRLRYEGFRAVMEKRFPRISHEVGHISTDMRSRDVGRQIEELVRSRRRETCALYFIPAYNTQLMDVLEREPLRETVIVLHDLDSSSHHFLEENLGAAVIYQNPVLQGYYAVKMLESVLETGRPPERKTINITHSVLLNENKDMFRSPPLLNGILG